MKFNCDALPDWWEARKKRKKQAFKDKQERLGKWHVWYAWYPAKVAHGDCRWLEPVMRRGEWTEVGLYGEYGWDFEYKEPSK